MQSRQILLKHRQQRKIALEEYQLCSKSIGDSQIDYPVDFIKRREAILNLELPYFITYECLPETKVSNVNFGQKTKKVFLNWIKQLDFELSAEDLGEIYWYKWIINRIENSNYAPNSKLVFKSIARQLAIETRNGKDATLNLIRLSRRLLSDGIDTFTLAAYFEYLEKRCTTYAIQPYKDLLEVRLLFYVPLSINKLREICFKDIDTHKKIIHFDNRNYPIPQTFIELVESLVPPDESIFKKDIKTLNKFIQQTSKAKQANIHHEITPKIIQKSLESIYLETGISKDIDFRR